MSANYRQVYWGSFETRYCGEFQWFWGAFILEIPRAEHWDSVGLQNSRHALSHLWLMLRGWLCIQGVNQSLIDERWESPPILWVLWRGQIRGVHVHAPAAGQLMAVVLNFYISFTCVFFLQLYLMICAFLHISSVIWGIVIVISVPAGAERADVRSQLWRLECGLCYYRDVRCEATLECGETLQPPGTHFQGENGTMCARLKIKKRFSYQGSYGFWKIMEKSKQSMENICVSRLLPPFSFL